jgi:hypothetical protein
MAMIVVKIWQLLYIKLPKMFQLAHDDLQETTCVTIIRLPT